MASVTIIVTIIAAILITIIMTTTMANIVMQLMNCKWNNYHYFDSVEINKMGYFLVLLKFNFRICLCFWIWINQKFVAPMMMQKSSKIGREKFEYKSKIWDLMFSKLISLERWKNQSIERLLLLKNKLSKITKICVN